LPKHVPLGGGLCFAPPAPAVAVPAPKEKPAKREKRKNDPQLIAKARELRDRYLEHVNAGALVLESAGKYDVVRQLIAAPAAEIRQLPNAA
jgi:hypothetical protein